MSDAALIAAIRAVLSGSPFHGEGHRKGSSALSVQGAIIGSLFEFADGNHAA
jgi:hypothetical protein